MKTIELRALQKKLLDLNTLQWLVPLFLGVTAVVFEVAEHSIDGDLQWNLPFVGELIIFGFMGPIIVAILIAWMRSLVEAEHKSNQRVIALNHELEEKVARRTAELAERNAQLAHANRELKHLDQMKSEFVSLVSHELRAPLTTLNGGLELALQNADALPEQARHTLETMVAESARLTSLVQTILDVSRLEAGKLEITLGPVAVRPLMEQALSVTLLPNSRPIEWHLSPKLPPVLADEIHLEQIVRNLLRNADKYSPAGLPIALSAQQEGNWVRIAVKDHGAGIEEDYHDYIFERFGRANSGEDAPPGWGLGLYFARKLIMAQGGTIAVNSPIWQNKEAPGSEFYLLLPIAEFDED
jgi:signal transduction histidine kinase